MMQTPKVNSMVIPRREVVVPLLLIARGLYGTVEYLWRPAYSALRNVAQNLRRACYDP